MPFCPGCSYSGKFVCASQISCESNSYARYRVSAEYCPHAGGWRGVASVRLARVHARDRAAHTTTPVHQGKHATYMNSRQRVAQLAAFIHRPSVASTISKAKWARSASKAPWTRSAWPKIFLRQTRFRRAFVISEHTVCRHVSTSSCRTDVRTST